MSHQAAYFRWVRRSWLLLAAATIAMISMAQSQALGADAPLATTDAPVAVGDETATLSGKVNPKGAAVAVCRFEYGTSTSYGAFAPCLPASLGTGSFNVAVSAQIEALEPGITYHYRLTATSVNGATSGVDQTFTTTGTGICPNLDRRLEQGIVAVQLPDCMALEQVNPSEKFSQRAVAPTISANGDRIAFKSLAALAETPGSLAPLYGDFYVASRGDAGWTTSPTSPPSPLNRGWGNDSFLARSFDPTLSSWFVLGSTVEGSQYQMGVGQVFRDSLSGPFQPLSPLLVPIDGGAHGSQNIESSHMQGAAADHSRLYFALGDSSATYLSGDPTPGGVGFDKNVYVAKLDEGGQPSLELLARDDGKDGDDKAWGNNCGVRLGGIGGSGVGWRNQGAVSGDGSRVYLSARAAQPASVACSESNKLRILKRSETSEGIDIAELIASECTRVLPVCKTEGEANGDDFYQGSSVDGSKVYFTTNRQLASSDLDGANANCSGSSGVSGCDLYLYDAEEASGERLTQVSAGEANAAHPVVGEGANLFNGTVAISGDGSHVYFAAGGVLTSDLNPAGKTATEYPAANPKLYAWDAASEAVEFIGAPAAAEIGLWGGAGTFLNNAYPVPATARTSSGQEIGGDGHILLFQSLAALTADDVDGGRRDTYRYDAAGAPATLQCVSCRPGGPDGEPFDVAVQAAESIPSQPGLSGTAFAEWSRWVSEDGASVLVRTSQPLVASDVNGSQDDYLWKSGQLTLLPGTTPPAGLLPLGDRPPVLSHDGSEVAFTGYSRLLPTDTDTAPDVYVARANGGFPNPPSPAVCIPGVNCQISGNPVPPMPETATSIFSGRGNVKSSAKTKCPKGKRKVTRKGKSRCVKRSTKRNGATKGRASRNQGGQK